MTDSNNLSRRRFLQATGGAAAAAAIAGCTGDDGDGDGGNDGNQSGGGGRQGTQVGENYLQLINSTMTTLDPIKATDTASGRVIQQLFDGLTNYPNGDIAAEALLAEDYQTSEDFTTYTFNIKQGVKYHDGSEVTAQDFIYSFERLAQSSNSRRQYFILDSLGVKHETQTVTNDDGEEEEQYKPGSLALNAPDDYTLEMELETPFASTIPMLAYSSFAVIPEGIVGDIEGYDGQMKHQEFATKNPIGCGPFEFRKWQTNTEAILDKYGDYHGEAAKVDGVRWQIIEDADASYSYARNKNADAFAIPTAKYNPNNLNVENTDEKGREVGTYDLDGTTVDYVGVATINTFYIAFNQKNVDEPAVRKAAAYALNQKTAIDQVFKGRGEGAYHFTPPNIYPDGAKAYDQHAKNNYPYGYNETQLDKARQVMEEAGYSESNRYQLTFTTYEDPSWQQIGQILRDQLASAYIDMQLEEAPFATLLQRGREGNLQAYSLGWIMDWPAPDNFLQNLVPELTVTSQEGGAKGAYVDWQGTEASRRAQQAWERIANNPEPTDQAEAARNEAYVQMEEANWQDVVLLPVYHRMDQLFNYQWVDMPKFGGGGFSRMKLNTTTLGDRN
ncbi:ABC transporter substrate-binding protein [Halegenticoccus soli]|uniref:ABC transporter substrate-binding protein n=1 Tax=Halegenticoccus soli TaxID=1985678 RepID=UPI000C6DCDEE|nr:ABC transporter substrate-binding protein [Halegenticoccus soli]